MSAKGKKIEDKKGANKSPEKPANPWKKPNRTDSPPKKGMTDCKHPKGTRTPWLKLAPSKVEGKPEFDLQVVHGMVTHACPDCQYAKTEITQTRQPTKADLGVKYGSEKFIPSKYLKALGEKVPEKKGKGAKAKVAVVPPEDVNPDSLRAEDNLSLDRPHGDDTPQVVPGSPAEEAVPQNHNPLMEVIKRETVKDEVELQDTETGVEDELDVESMSVGSEELSLPEEAHERAAPSEFWVNFRTYEMVQRHNNDFRKNSIEPSPFGTIGMLLKDLLAERHALSGEHDLDRLTAALAAASTEVCSDFEEIKKFVLLLRHATAAEQNPIQEALVAFWELGIDKNGDAHVGYQSKLSQWLFSWLGVPEDDFFPAGLRRFNRDLDIRIGIGERGKEPAKPAETADILDTLEKRDDDLAKKRAADAKAAAIRKAEDDKIKAAIEAENKLKEKRREFEGKHQYPDKAMTSEWIETQARMALGRISRIESVHTYSDEATGEHGAVPLLPPRAGFDMDADSEQLLTAVSLYNEEAGTRTLILNLTDSGLAVRSVMTESGPLLLICQPTVRPRGAK